MFFGLKIKTPLAFYYYILILLILVTFILSRILKSRFGRAIVAVREDEIAASAMGVNVFLVKIVAFAISAMVAGLVGTFYAITWVCEGLEYICPLNRSEPRRRLQLKLGGSFQ